MKKIFLSLAALLFLASCNDISGTLEVLKKFEATVIKKCGWDPFNHCAPTQAIQVGAGNYQSRIDFGSKKQIKIEMKANAFNETILLSRPKNFEIPENGEFHLSAAEIGQNFDINGGVRTTRWDSQPQRGYESCQYTVSQYVCYPGQDGKPVCQYENRQVWGQQFVEFFYRNVARDLVATMAQGSDQLATFTGTKNEAEKIYTYQGLCR